MRLDEITAAHPGMRGMQLDVEDTAALDGFAAAVQEEFPGLNVLINNAGISRQEDLTTGSADISVALETIQTNIVSVLQLTAALLPTLRKQPRSTILTTTSGLAFVPGAGYPTYCASKAFLHSWLQSLRVQLRGTSVAVLELVPSYVQTELTGPGQATDPYAVPLEDYIAEEMQLLGEPNPPHGEILNEGVRAFRWAERNGDYEQVFAGMNAGEPT